MTLSKTNAVTIDVCESCYVCLGSGECDDTGTCTHMSKVADGCTLTVGCLNCERCTCCDMPQCECGYYGDGHGFSWYPCDGCGSTSGGNRYPVTVWEE